MKNWVYILKNKTSGKYYCGQTEHLVRRLREHNDALRSGVKWTRKSVGEWEMVWSREVGSRSEAMLMERKIKGRGIRRYLESNGPAESRSG